MTSDERQPRNRVVSLCGNPWIVKDCGSGKHNPENHEPGAWSPVTIQPRANSNKQCSHYSGRTVAIKGLK